MLKTMKINRLYFLFFIGFIYFQPLSIFAQSIGFSAGIALTHISKANFNSSSNLSDFQIADYNQRLSLGICLEYPLSSRLQLRTELNYFNTGYELRLYYDYDTYRAKGFGFSTIQGALLAETTMLTISAKTYLAAHGGLGIGYTNLNRMKTGVHSGGRASATIPTTFEDNTMLIINSKVSLTAIIGVSFQKITTKGKLFIRASYHRAFNSSPSADMKLVMNQNNQRIDYSQTLSPNIHFLNISVGYAWLLKKK
jgi:hypothetical protein